MTRSIDEDEHSIELHLPYIHRRLQQQHPDLSPAQYPPLVPIMVGSTSPATEQAFGTLLAPYITDPSNVFIISSDFCHWGLRFNYTYYVPQAPHPGPRLPLSSPALPQPPRTPADVASVDQQADLVADGKSLQRRDRVQSAVPAIHESISAFDLATMAAITTGVTEKFLDILKSTGNTVCGRHPIGVIMAGIAAANGSSSDSVDGSGSGSGRDSEKGKFHFIRYERSSDATDVADSSVSYVSAFAVL